MVSLSNNLLCHVRSGLLLVALFFVSMPGFAVYEIKNTDKGSVLVGRVCCYIPGVDPYRPNAKAIDYFNTLSQDAMSTKSRRPDVWGQTSPMYQKKTYNRNVEFTIMGDAIIGRIVNEDLPSSRYAQFICGHLVTGTSKEAGSVGRECSKNRIHFYSRTFEMNCGNQTELGLCQIRAKDIKR